MSAVAAEAVGKFASFIRYVDPTYLSIKEEHKDLASFIMFWLRNSSSAAKACAYDYEVFLTVVIAITAEWCRDPSILDYVDGTQRRVTQFFQPGNGYGDCLLEPHTFKFIVANPGAWSQYTELW